ncbi:MAG TPA: hypothetical protein VMS93_08485 [Candidatus Saccharimonadales bacterium]|nr:hypothetical protein [Candidatus Saccharimonadales bacterium]
MRRVLVVAAVLALIALPAVGQAKGAGKTATRTVKGEVVDTGCYMAKGAAATGEGHKECAGKCFANGMPAGLLTEKGELLLLLPDHQNGQPYKDALGMPGEQLEISGTMMTRNGMKALSVTAVKKSGA